MNKTCVALRRTRPCVSRRRLLNAFGITAAGSGAAGLLVGCVTGRSTAMTTEQQLELNASQAVEAIRSGRLSAESYATTLLTRAERLSGM